MSAMLNNIATFVAPYAVGLATNLGVFAHKETTERLIAELDEITGSSDFTSLIIKFTPFIQKITNGILDGNRDQIDNFLLQALCNAFRQLPTSTKCDPIVLLIEHIAASLSKIDSSQESVEIVTDELLKLFFPLNEEDLPLSTGLLTGTCRKIAWTKLREKLIVYARTLHEDFNSINSDPYELAFLKNGEKGKSLLQKCHELSKTLSSSISKILAENSAVCAAQVTKVLSEQERLSKIIQEISSEDSKKFSPIWGFLEKQIEPIILHVVGHLTEYGQKEISSQIINVLNQSIQSMPIESWGSSTIETLFNEIKFSKNTIPAAKILIENFYPLLEKHAVIQVTEIYTRLQEILSANIKLGEVLPSVIGDSNGKKVTNAVLNFSDEIRKKLIGAEDQSPVGNLTKQIIESAILATCTKFFNRIKIFDSADVLSETTIKILNLVANHFELINITKAQEKKLYSHDVSYPIFACLFEKMQYLTPGLVKSSEAQKMSDILDEIKNLKKQSEDTFLIDLKAEINRLISEKYVELSNLKEIIRKERIKNFFIPLTKDLCKILGLTSFQIPAPSLEISQNVWMKLTVEIAPKILSDIYENLLDPNAIYSSLLSLSQTPSVSIEGESVSIEGESVSIEGETVDALDEEEILMDLESREKMDQALKKIIVEANKIIPKTILEPIFSVETLNEMSANDIGKKIRQQLKKLDISKILQKAIVDGLSKFKSEEPAVVEEVDLLKTKNKLEAALVDMIIFNGTGAGKAQLLSYWDALHKRIELFIGAVFGKGGLYLKKSVDVLSYYIFISCLGTIISFVMSPLNGLATKIAHHHVRTNVRVGIEALGLPINEDLLLKLTHTLVNNLVPSKE